MLGACYLTEWTPDLDRLYEIGEEVEVYRTPEELTDKARDLLADPGHRRALRRQGQRRALAQHTIPQTLRLIAENLAMEN
jgi:spore maturation protein CgeB